MKMELYANNRSEGVSTKQLKRRNLKNSGLNGNRTHDLCDTGAVQVELNDIERQVLNGMLEPFVGDLIKKKNKKSPGGIGPRRFSPSPWGAKYVTVTQDMCLYGIKF